MSSKHNPPVFPTAAEDVEHAKKTLLNSAAYRLAYTDEEFLLRDDLRAVRLQLEWLKPDLIMDEHGIESTVVIFGGARFKAGPSSHSNSAVERNLAANSRYYDEARKLAHTITELSLQHQGREYVIVTGGGPGIMEAANRGAAEAGGKSIGLNIVLPSEQEPNPYVTPQLCFQFHYFALRKMHFLKRARGLITFPGGFGTLDELFDTLTLIQTHKIKPVPVVLVGKDYWRQLINFDFLVEQGAIEAKDVDIFTIVDSAEEAWALLKSVW